MKKTCSWRRSWISVYLEVQYCRSQHYGTCRHKHKGTNWYQHGHKAESFVLTDPSLLLCPIYVSVFSKLNFALVSRTHKNPDEDKIWHITKLTDQTVIWFSEDWPSEHNFPFNDRRYTIFPVWRNIAMFEVLWVSPACPSGKSSIRWIWLWRTEEKTEIFGENPVPLLLLPPEIPRGPARDRTKTFAVISRRLRDGTACKY